MKNVFKLTFIGMALCFSACKEQGCTDPFADNYSETAEENDGSCTYGVNLIFYFNEARADYYYDAGAYSPIHVEINGTDVGNVNWFTTMEEAPDCGTVGGTVNYKLEMSKKFEMTEFKFVDEMGNTIVTRSESIAISDGDCQAFLF